MSRLPLRTIPKILIPAILLGLTNCARIPSGVQNNSGGQIFVTLTVAGNIDPTLYYFVIFNTNTAAATAGNLPGPAIAPPWINGFGTGNITQYVEYNQTQPTNYFGLYAFPAGDTTDTPPATSIVNQLINELVGPSPTGSGTQLSFQIPISALATTAIPDVTTLQMTFITTDAVPVGGGSVPASGKNFDALGTISGGAFSSNPITIPVSAGSYVSGNGYPTGSGVCQCPTGTPASTSLSDYNNLQITNWSVVVEP